MFGSFCEGCEKRAARCAICQLPVEGMYLWCQVCSHGGHLDHVSDWFSKYKKCPVGCGHQCTPEQVFLSDVIQAKNNYF